MLYFPYIWRIKVSLPSDLQTIWNTIKNYNLPRKEVYLPTFPVPENVRPELWIISQKNSPFLALFDLLKAGDEVTPDLGKEFEEPGLTGAGDSDLRIVIFRSTRFSLHVTWLRWVSVLRTLNTRTRVENRKHTCHTGRRESTHVGYQSCHERNSNRPNEFKGKVDTFWSICIML